MEGDFQDNTPLGNGTCRWGSWEGGAVSPPSVSGHVCGPARCARTCPSVAQACECAGECGEPSRNRDMGFFFCCLPIRQPLPSPSRPPASWSHLVLIYFNKIGLGPCPEPGRAASLRALPGDSPRAAVALGPPGAAFRLSLNPPSAPQRGARCQPCLPQASHAQSFRDLPCGRPSPSPPSQPLTSLP